MGTYEAHVSFMAYGSADPVARSECREPLALRAADANILVGHDNGYFIEFQGCRIRATRSGNSLLATSAACEPTSAGLAGLAARVYEELELDAAAGTLHATSASLGETAEGRCNQVDGIVRKVGGDPLIFPETLALIANSEATSEVSGHIESENQGYLERLQDGKGYLLGLGCTLPGTTGAGDMRTLDAGACESRFGGDHEIPSFVPTSYSWTDGELVLVGTFGEGEAGFAYELSSTSLVAGWHSP